MNAEALLDLIGRHLDHVRSSLTDEEFGQLGEAVGELSRARGDAAARRALYRMRRALLPLPLDSPVRAAVDQLRLGTTAPVRIEPQWASALLLLLEREEAPADPDVAHDDAVHDVLRAARRRLLAAPSRAEGELDPHTAADPLAAGLIRLIDPQKPERGARYPDFQFDPGGGPRAVVQRVNRLLLADQDPWGAADWWLGGNRWLGGTPAELIGRVPDALLAAAAQALVEGD